MIGEIVRYWTKWGEELTLPQLREIVKGNQIELHETSKEMQDQFVKANPEMKHSEEFKAGDILDEYRNGKVYQPVVYRFFSEGKHWVSARLNDQIAYNPEEIRKLQPDQLKELADEVLKNNNLDLIGDNTPVEILLKDVKSMLIEMGKKVKELNL